MNKSTVYVAVFGVLCVLAGVLVGAGVVKSSALPCSCSEKPHFTQRAERFMGYRGHSGEKPDKNSALEVFTAKLGLNPEQKAKVTEILDAMRREIDEVGKNVRGSIAGIKEKSDKQIMEILTPEQQEKFKALQKKFEKGRWSKGEHGQRPGGKLPPPPHS